MEVRQRPRRRRHLLDATSAGWIMGFFLWPGKAEENDGDIGLQGEAGKLLIKGHTLERGYLGDEEKTKAAFVDV